MTSAPKYRSAIYHSAARSPSRRCVEGGLAESLVGKEVSAPSPPRSRRRADSFRRRLSSAISRQRIRQAVRTWRHRRVVSDRRRRQRLIAFLISPSLEEVARVASGVGSESLHSSANAAQVEETVTLPASPFRCAPCEPTLPLPGERAKSQTPLQRFVNHNRCKT